MLDKISHLSPLFGLLSPLVGIVTFFIFAPLCMLQLRLFTHQKKRLKTWQHLLMNY